MANLKKREIIILALAGLAVCTVFMNISSRIVCSVKKFQ